MPGIDITPADIIKRPDSLLTGAKAAADKGIIQQIKEGLKQYQELKKLLEDSGIDISNLGLGNLGGLLNLGGRKGGERVDNEMRTPTQANPQMQFKMFIAALQARYGDITLNELVEKLKDDYGERRLSQILRG